MGSVSDDQKPKTKREKPWRQPGLLIVLRLRSLLVFKRQMYSLLADMWSGHQFLDEVIQTHLSLLDEGCR